MERVFKEKVIPKLGGGETTYKVTYGDDTIIALRKAGVTHASLGPDGFRPLNQEDLIRGSTVRYKLVSGEVLPQLDFPFDTPDALHYRVLLNMWLNKDTSIIIKPNLIQRLKTLLIKYKLWVK